MQFFKGTLLSTQQFSKSDQFVKFAVFVLFPGGASETTPSDAAVNDLVLNRLTQFDAVNLKIAEITLNIFKIHYVLD